LIWSTTPLAIKWSGEGTGVLFAVTARMLIGVVLCMIVLRVLRVAMPWHRRAVSTYLASGISIYGAMLSVYWSSQYISSGLISVLFGMAPIFTGVLATVALREQSFSVARVFGMLFGLVGLGVVFAGDLRGNGGTPTALLGIGAVVFATLLHSVSTVLVKAAGAHLPALATTTGGLLVSTPAFLLTWWMFDGLLPTSIPSQSLYAIVYLGIFGSALGFVLFFYALKHMEAGRIAMIPLITPVLALFLGHVLNNETISQAIFLGTVLIMSGLVVYEWGGRLAWPQPARADDV
jgi:drug/metabolite transporter (DMT)-like permease